MSAIQAVIFDMDGVIVDSEPSHESAFFHVVEEIGYGTRHGMVFADYVGRTDEALWQDFLAKHRPPHSLQDLLTRKSAKVLEILRRDEPIFPGLYELVQNLSQRYRLGLASGSDRSVVNAVLSLKALGQFFRVTISCSEISRGKPAPDIFLQASKELQVAPEHCVVIEDSKPGVAAGLAAGMTVIAITNTHARRELDHAHYVVDSYEEIGKLLLEGLDQK
jgi:HAD superfamily hydrolase (TIGR01509 family)